MPHGDFSDLGALACLAGGFQMMFAPSYQFQDFLPLKAQFTTATPDVEAMIRMMGGFLVILGCMLFTVRWNVVNGKLSGLACIGCGANMAFTMYSRLDAEVFVPRQFYVFAGLLPLVGLHLMFNANPIIKAAKKD
ncbi:hypothetical protein CYMTET_16689 [Cymbomonas tetramitiformis]|uniref:Uncharacterized protein n=1 Tax=Cymbomonas tetramitiformis TaxID=36881 RepID=A0AAE0L7R5_9CHLO|nr:hypothetical protein CYMTET_16689 [Cymbomonas tetramitiformis]|eukprot:gene11528-13622_t